MEEIRNSMSLMGVNIGAPDTVGHIVNVAELYGLSAGTIVDFTGQYSGTAWDFSLEDHRQAARAVSVVLCLWL